MREWLKETHGTQFELFRHFLLRFFDSDLVTAPGHASAGLIAVVSLCLPWFQLMIAPLKLKYAHLSSLPVPGPYREAVRADELWLITLMMALIGLLTACKWQALFPDLRDYRALGALPLRARHIFVAKLLALLLVAAAALAVLNLIPCAGFPALSAGRWAFQAAPGLRIKAYAEASIAACGFFFFGLVALQGVLLNLLRPRAFGRVTGYLQGLLVALMLGLIVMSFSIEPQVARAVIQPAWSRWLPPVWFVGLCQHLSADPDPRMHALAGRAALSLAVAITLALLTYAVSYHRHRTVLVEGTAGPAKDHRFGDVLGWFIADPREHAVAGFISQTLSRSGHHRTILMGYGGLAFAVLLSGELGMGNWVGQGRAAASAFIYFHVIAMWFLLIGARHLFSIPIEWKANWLFQITEGEGRAAWLRAFERLLLFTGTLLVTLPLPFEIRSLGWRGSAEAALSGALGLCAYEWGFSTWNKLPFTCSHFPGKTPGWMRALQFFGVILLVPLLNAAVLATLYNPVILGVVLIGLAAAWTRMRALRVGGWHDLRLQYEEMPEPAVNGLNLPR